MDLNYVIYRQSSSLTQATYSVNEDGSVLIFPQGWTNIGPTELHFQLLHQFYQYQPVR